MMPNGDIAVIFEDGVLKPETDLGLPEHTRVMISIRRVETSAEDRAWARQEMCRIREAGLVKSDGRRYTRDELHERD